MLGIKSTISGMIQVQAVSPKKNEIKTETGGRKLTQTESLPPINQYKPNNLDSPLSPLDSRST